MNTYTLSAIIVLFVLLCMVGCSGNHCIKVGGTFDGKTGEFQYCWDDLKSIESGIPVITGADGTSYYGFTEAQIEKALIKASCGKEVSAKANKVPASQLLELLKEE